MPVAAGSIGRCRASQGETTSDDHNCTNISPQIGITDTPVIDKAGGPNGAIYSWP